MKQLFSKFLVAFLLTSAVVLSWSEYFFEDVLTQNLLSKMRLLFKVWLLFKYGITRYMKKVILHNFYKIASLQHFMHFNFWHGFSVYSRYIDRVVYVRANLFLIHQKRNPSLSLQFYKYEGDFERF